VSPPVHLLPPPRDAKVYSLVLDLDETLVHYFEDGGGSMGRHEIRPGLQDFLSRMSRAGWEIVVFTAATQDYADWMLDLVDTERRIQHRLYRQHALPWGPIFVKDLSRLGRDLDRTLIVDNVQENFMLQPDHGIFIFPWYDDPHDNALFALTPLLEEIVNTKANVPEMLAKYSDQIPKWAGFTEGRQWGMYGAASGSAEFAYEADAYDYEADQPPPQSPSVSGPYAQPRQDAAFVAKPSSPFGPYQAAPPPRRR